MIVFLQFLGVLVAVLLLQVTAGVLRYLFTDLVTSHGTVAMARSSVVVMMMMSFR